MKNETIFGINLFIIERVICSPSRGIPKNLKGSIIDTPKKFMENAPAKNNAPDNSEIFPAVCTKLTVVTTVAFCEKNKE